MNRTDILILAGLIGGGYLIDQLMAGHSSIGKIVDTYPLKPNSRVDRAWAARSISDRMLVGANRPNLYKYADPQELMATFNLYSVEFGNWMNQEDRANFAFATGAALVDLARIIGIPQGKVGFSKRLSITLGSRGRGGRVAAFYMPDPYELINITKPHGHMGVFAHEYGHAIDRRIGTKYQLRDYASGGRSTRKKVDHDLLNSKKTGPQYLFERLFQQLFWDEKGNYTSYQAQLLNTGSDYLNRRTEVWARVFETYCRIIMQEKGIENNFLVQSRSDAGLPPVALVKKCRATISRILKLAY